MVMLHAQKTFWMIARICLSCPPLLLVPAAVVYFPWHVLGLDAAVYFPWHVPGLDAAVKAMALGSAAFAAGFCRPRSRPGIGLVSSLLFHDPRVILTFPNTSFAA
jgi:hypothetical protein